MAFDLTSIIPEGWAAVDYRKPVPGDDVLAVGGEAAYAKAGSPLHSSSYPSIILKRKRWRAKGGDNYYYVTETLRLDCTSEDAYRIDEQRYEVGNYFKTKEEAEAVAEKIRALLKEGAE